MKNFDVSAFFPYQAIVDRPPIKWPNGAKIAIWVIPNIEHYHIDLFKPGNLDVRNFSRIDYGNRVGIWRVMEVLEKYGVKGTVALNGEVCQYYPRIVEAAIELKWEFMGHGLSNSIFMNTLSREEEEKVISATKKAIEGFGQTVRGWLGPGLAESYDTLNLLSKHGFEYVSDWVNDDLPYRMTNGLYSIPYSLEINDMPLFNNPSISNGEFLQRICDSFDVLYEEGGRNGRVMGIALHPFLIGAAHRIKYLDKALQYISSHDGVWFATGHEIIEAYRAQD